MRPLLDSDRLGNHDLLGEDEPSSDLVLGAPALLGIFFALALICAVFFGFGYSSGHGLHLPGHSAAAATASAMSAATSNASASSTSTSPSSQATATEDAETGLAPQPDAGSATQREATQRVAKPSPDTASSEAPGFPPSEAATAATPAARSTKPSAGEPPSGQTASAFRSAAAPVIAGTPSQRTVTAQLSQPRPQASEKLPAPAPPVAAPPASSPVGLPVSLMVQIAAVSRAADAQTLATALRHDGFPALVRTSTTDSFFHVQVGPFPTRDAAKAMRARLADSGYNAFIKQ